ncbi:hypothetical protein ACIBG7_19005 [Nonomuraea sp. NPDC050328]|uniref:hypothetical protein n=1 Tax=Nonomuraea sp. NPDC050328 TaxID=3364361 RepID=UPI0037B3F329
MSATVPPAELTYATLAEAVQSLMSVTVPFLSALLAADLWKTARTARLLPTLLASALMAAAVGIFGSLVSAVALAVASAHADPWQNAGTVAVGGVLVQIVAQSVGTGLALLLRSPLIASIGTIVLPMGLWWLLGSIEPLQPAQPWLTPYAVVQSLLSEQTSPVIWAQWLVVLLVWGGGLNTLGALSLKRGRDARS